MPTRMQLYFRTSITSGQPCQRKTAHPHPAPTPTDLVRDIRASSDPGLMEVFLAEYGLSTDEGIALMCLAEALLRVPDAENDRPTLIEDKIAPSDWGKHLGHSASSVGQCLDLGADADRPRVGRPEPSPASPRTVAQRRQALGRAGDPRRRWRAPCARWGGSLSLGEDIQKAMDRADRGCRRRVYL